jgi:hypothetical protein
LAKAINEDSKIRVRNIEDVYHALTDKETLEKIMQQGLKEDTSNIKTKV